MAVWDALAPRLADVGYRVLRYDHFGRGFSDRLHVEHDPGLYDRQLIELLDVVGWREPVTVIGSSMGAIVATELALRHPERVANLVFSGPAGFPIEAGGGAKLLQVPALGAYLMRVLGDRNLSSHHRKYFVEPAKFQDAQAAFEAQLAFNGTKRSIRSTMMNMPITGFCEGYRRLGDTKQPVLLVWGREDKTFPYTNHERALQLVPQAKLVTVAAAAHLPQLEQVEVVLTAIVEFVRAQSGAR
jgi:pimeloyl-ACP methyl ester carboxylesterase